MAILEQKSNITMYTGWYGSCDSECLGFDLTPESIRGILDLVRISDSSHGAENLFDPYYDDFFSDFTSLECGRIYRIELRPGDGEIDIPGFVVTTSDSPGEGRVTTDCTGVPPEPTPTSTLIPGQTPFPTETPEPTPTSTLFPGQTPYPTATPVPTPTSTTDQTPDPTGTPEPTPTSTLAPGQTPYPTSTPTPTPTLPFVPVPTPTLAPGQTPYPTATPSPTPTATYIPGDGDVYALCYPGEGYVYDICLPYLPGQGDIYTLCDTSFLPTKCRVYRRCIDDETPTSSCVPGIHGRLNIRFQSGSGFYKEGGVANIAIIREDQSLDDEFTVDYATNSITATNTDYKSVRGTVKFAKGQNNRYINIPIFTDELDDNNNIFQVILTNMFTTNSNAITDITLADHTGIIVNSDTPSLHESIDVESPVEDCGCPEVLDILDEITVPWLEEAATVIRYKDICYYKTTICRCDDLCTSYEALNTFDDCADCRIMNGVVYKLCGDVYKLCGDVYEICDDTYYWQNQSGIWSNIGNSSCD